jgi:hypothetical protein
MKIKMNFRIGINRLLKPLTATIIISLAAILQGCGGNGAGSSGSGGVGGSAAVKSAASVALLTSAPSLSSDGKTKSTITVFVKDAANLVLKNAQVDLSTNDPDSVLQSSGTRTADDGTVTATLSSTGKANRVIQVKAIVGDIVKVLDIPVTGTLLTVSGPLSVTVNGTADYTAALKDSSGNGVGGLPVTLRSSAGNTFTPASVVTDSNGQARFKINATRAGVDNWTAEAGGAGFPFSVNVASTQLVITGVSAGEEVVVGASKTIGILLTQNGVPAASKTLVVSATRGTVAALPGGGATVITNTSGVASFSITSPTAGVSSISVTGLDGTIATSAVEFISTTPAVVKLQVSKSVVSANAIGSSTNTSQLNTSDLIATVQDAAGNPVKNITVTFSAINDPSAGSVSPGYAITDRAGVASVTFVAGPKSTGPDEVIMSAAVGTGSITSIAKLTVASRGISVRIGTGSSLVPDGLTRYSFPWNALVVDSAGAPIEGAVVTVQVVPTGYFKGNWAFGPDSGVAGATELWRPTAYKTDLSGRRLPLPIPPATTSFPTPIARAFCPSEDTSPQDGSLQQGIEDLNNNGRLDPGNIASSNVGAAGIKTGPNGFIDFTITYARSYALFASVRIDVKVQVAGTESVVSQEFVLPFSYDDARKPDGAPLVGSGSEGPFGAIVSDMQLDGVVTPACRNPY